MLGEHGFHQALVAGGVSGGEGVFKNFIQLTVLDLGWDVLALKKLLRRGSLLRVML